MGGSGVGVLNFVSTVDPAPAASDIDETEELPELAVADGESSTPEPPASESDLDLEQNAHDPVSAPEPAMDPGAEPAPHDVPEPWDDSGGEAENIPEEIADEIPPAQEGPPVPESGPEQDADLSAASSVPSMNPGAGDGAFDDKPEPRDDSGSEAEGPGSENKQDSEEYADPAENKMRVILKALKSIEENISNVIHLLEEEGVSDMPLMKTGQGSPAMPKHDPDDPGQGSPGGRVVEGVFNGQHMVGSDGKIYSVPPNYASKSKLVEGDMLKLTISGSGTFIYKQIGPIERKRVVAVLGFDPTTGEYYATEGNKRWNIIKASVTYFKGEPGDEAVLLIPKEEPSKWAAVENIIKKSGIDQRTEE